MIKMLSASNACLREVCLHVKDRYVGLEVLQFFFCSYKTRDLV